MRRKSTFAKRLERVLEYRKISQADLAKKLSVSRACVSSWCAGTSTPLMGHFEHIARVLEVRKAYLLGDEEVRVPADLVRQHRKLLEQGGVDRREAERRSDELNDFLLYLRCRTRGKATDS